MWFKHFCFHLTLKHCAFNETKNPLTKTHNAVKLTPEKCDKCLSAQMKDLSTDQTPGQQSTLLSVVLSLSNQRDIISTFAWFLVAESDDVYLKDFLVEPLFLHIGIHSKGGSDFFLAQERFSLLSNIHDTHNTFI